MDPMRLTLSLLVLVLGACATARTPGTVDGADAELDAGTTPMLGDGSLAALDGAKARTDGGSGAEASADGANVSDAADASSGLDPALELPSASGATCSTPGSGNECALASVCRIASPSDGRCESCTNCGNLNAACNASDECDIVFQCFQGHCTNFCHLGTYECGAINDCLDVGHPTIGMCKP